MFSTPDIVIVFVEIPLGSVLQAKMLWSEMLQLAIWMKLGIQVKWRLLALQYGRLPSLSHGLTGPGTEDRR